MKKNSKNIKLRVAVGRLGILGFVAGFLVSCGSSPGFDPVAFQKAQEQAHAARSAYHQDQMSRDYASSTSSEPEVPPNKVRYYRVPVEAHVDGDGLLIEAHKLTLEIVQP